MTKSEIVRELKILKDVLPHSPDSSDIRYVRALTDDIGDIDTRAASVHSMDAVVKAITPNLPFITNPDSSGAVNAIARMIHVDPPKKGDRPQALAKKYSAKVAERSVRESVSAMDVRDVFIVNALRLVDLENLFKLRGEHGPVRDAVQEEMQLYASEAALNTPDLGVEHIVTTRLCNDALLGGAGWVIGSLMEDEGILDAEAKTADVLKRVRARLQDTELLRHISRAAGSSLIDLTIVVEAHELLHPDTESVIKRERNNVNPDLPDKDPRAVGCPARSNKNAMAWAPHFLLSGYMAVNAVDQLTTQSLRWP